MKDETNTSPSVESGSRSDLSPIKIWRAIAQPYDVAPRVTVFGTLLLFIAYTVFTVIRHDPDVLLRTWLRLAVVAYAALGVMLSKRLTWHSGRWYVLGLAYLLPITAVVIEGLYGTPPRAPQSPASDC